MTIDKKIKEENKFVKGCKSFYNNYLIFSSYMADNLPTDEVEKVYRANGEGGLLAIMSIVPLHNLNPIATATAISLIFAGGKGLYNASRLRDRYLDEVLYVKPNKDSKMYKFGQGLKRITERTFNWFPSQKP